MTARHVVVAVLLVTACRRPVPPPAVVTVAVPSTLPVEPPWIAARAAVEAAVDSGRFALADSLLGSFEQTERGTADASESVFWRAMLRADPRNPAFSASAARAALEGYLASTGAQRRTEASVILRHLALADSLRAAQATQRAAADVRDRTRDEELQKLRDELQRTQAELDRIKRRLGAPKP